MEERPRKWRSGSLLQTYLLFMNLPSPSQAASQSVSQLPCEVPVEDTMTPRDMCSLSSEWLSVCEKKHPARCGKVFWFILPGVTASKT